MCAPSRSCLASAREYDAAGVKSNGQDYPVNQTTFYAVMRSRGCKCIWQCVTLARRPRNGGSRAALAVHTLSLAHALSFLSLSLSESRFLRVSFPAVSFPAVSFPAVVADHVMTTGKDDLTKASQLGSKLSPPYPGCSDCVPGDGKWHLDELGFSDALRYSGKEDVVDKPVPHEMYGLFLLNHSVDVNGILDLGLISPLSRTMRGSTPARNPPCDLLYSLLSPHACRVLVWCLRSDVAN